MNQHMPTPSHAEPVPARDDLLGQIGSLQARLVRSDAELEAAQRLRYRIFSDEFGAVFSAECAAEEIDKDHHDKFSDHLIVIDTALAGEDHERIIGTYRLTTRSKLPNGTSFYTAGEFDIAPLINRNSSLTFMELGRSCVLPAWRGKRTIELLWHGIWAWCRKNSVDVMLGCASFAGVVPQAHALALSFLHHHALARGDWAVSAVSDRRISMDMMPVEAIRTREALMAMPPLIKGYLRLGAKFGDGAVIDPVFRTTDVLVILPVASISARYLAHYREDAGRFAA